MIYKFELDEVFVFFLKDRQEKNMTHTHTTPESLLFAKTVTETVATLKEYE